MAFVAKTGIKCGPTAQDCENHLMVCRTATRTPEEYSVCYASYVACMNELMSQKGLIVSSKSGKGGSGKKKTKKS
jgi:hypothetical protein